MQPYLEKLQVTGKRSRRDKSINIKLLTEANSKQRQPQNCMQNADASNSRQKDQRNLNGCSPSTWSMACSSSNSPGVIIGPNLAVVVEKETCLFSAERKLQSESMDISDHLKLGGLPQGRELISS